MKDHKNYTNIIRHVFVPTNFTPIIYDVDRSLLFNHTQIEINISIPPNCPFFHEYTVT